MRKNKVIILDNVVIKKKVIIEYPWYNLGNLYNLFGVKHKRELRVYKYIQENGTDFLKVPKVEYFDGQIIVLEKLNVSDSPPIFDPHNLIRSLTELSNLGQFLPVFRISSLLSSPGLSLLRVLFQNFRYIGPKEFFRFIYLLTKYTLITIGNTNRYLLHRDLSWHDNLIQQDDSVYFIDFGESIITKRYFLNDIVTLAVSYKLPITEKGNFSVDYSLVLKYIANNEYMQSNNRLSLQLYLVTLRKILLLNNRDKKKYKKINKKNLKHIIKNVNYKI